MVRKLFGLALLSLPVVLGISNTAQADGRFSFGLSIWGPPPVYYGPPGIYDPYYPPPVVVRRVYVPVQPETVYVRPAPTIVNPAPAPAPAPAPLTSHRSKSADMVLVKIGELHS